VADVRGFQVRADQPEDKGGTNTGPKPSEMFLACLALCFGHVVVVHCRDRGIPYEGMSITVSGEKMEADGQQFWGNLRIHLHLPEQLPQSRVRAILRHAEKACSVGGTVTRPGHIEHTVTTGGAQQPR
jgi:putative redox protein